MTDLFEIIKKDKDKVDRAREAQHRKEKTEGAKVFTQLKKKHEDKFFRILNKFFGTDLDWKVIAFDSVHYDPSHYYQRIEMDPDYMVVSIPESKDHFAFMLRVSCRRGEYPVAYVTDFGMPTPLISPGRLYHFISKI